MHWILSAGLLLGACAVPRPARTELALAHSPATTTSPADLRPAGPLPPERRPKNYFDIMFGTSYWSDLGGLDPRGVSPWPGRFGDFDAWGFAFDMGYDRVVAGNRNSDLTVGLEFGWNTFANDGTGLASPYSHISASMYYVTPVVRWLLHLSPRVTIAPGLGAGYYGFSIDETETYYYGPWWGYQSRTLNRDDALGGFASLGIDFHFSPESAVRIDNKLHFVEFGGLQSLLPLESDVDGPIYTLEIGFVLSM